MRPRHPRALALVGALASSAAAGVVFGSVPAAHAVEIYSLPSSGTVTVTGKGNGHGHGMSQYGAQGAAIAGLTSTQIMAFYYPGTTLTTLAASNIRVLLSSAGAYPTVVAQAGLNLNYSGGNHALPTSGISRYRLVNAGAGTKLQKLTTAWADVAGYTALPRQANFVNPGSGLVRLVRGDIGYNEYRGLVGGYNNGSSTWSINTVSLDQYTQGVVPRESPSSWRAAALQAQAIAARTYGRNAVESHTTSAYDICDTTSCQVYGGYQRLDAAGNRLYGEESTTNQAVAATANKVLRYNGTTVFAQFSASNGGWTSYGGYTYLPHKADPYDNSASGDPYLSWTRSISVASIASAAGLAHATAVEITQREGGGTWNGRVLQLYVDGTYSNGNTGRVQLTSGTVLSLFGGWRSNWFTLSGTEPPPPPPPPATNGGALTASSSTETDAFHIDGAGHLQWHAWTPGAGWQNTDLGAPSAGSVQWDPAAGSAGDGSMTVAARDGAGNLVTRAYTVGTGWTSWQPSTIAITASPALVVPVAGELDIVYRGANNVLYTRTWTTNNGWVGPVAIPRQVASASGPAVAKTNGTNLVLVYRGTDGVLRTAARTNGVWRDPKPVPTPLPTPMAALDPGVSGAGGSTVWYVGTDATVYYATLASGTWSSWQQVPGNGVTSAASAWSAAGGYTLFAQVSGHFATQAYAAASHTWRSWAAIPGT